MNLRLAAAQLLAVVLLAPAAAQPADPPGNPPPLVPPFEDTRSRADQLTQQITEIARVNVCPGGEDADDFAFWLFTQIFGDFIWIPFSGDQCVTESVTLVTHMLGFMNIVALALAIFIMGYVLASAMIDTAQDGVPLGREVDSFWMPFRNGVAMTLLLPVPVIGKGILSVAQTFVVWLLVWGSSAGSAVWNYATEYASRGVDLTQTSSPGSSFAGDLANAQNLMSAMVCETALAPHLGGASIWRSITGMFSDEADPGSSPTPAPTPTPRPGRGGAGGARPGPGTLEPPSTPSAATPMRDFGGLVAALRNPVNRPDTYAFSDGRCGSIRLPTARGIMPELGGEGRQASGAGGMSATQAAEVICSTPPDYETVPGKRCEQARAYATIEDAVAESQAALIEDLRDFVVHPLLERESMQALAAATAYVPSDGAPAHPEDLAAHRAASREVAGYADVLYDIVAANRSVRDARVEDAMERLSQTQESWQENMSQRGWAYGGMFFLELSRAQHEYAQARSLSRAVTTAPARPGECWEGEPGERGAVGCDRTTPPNNDVDAALFVTAQVGTAALTLADVDRFEAPDFAAGGAAYSAPGNLFGDGSVDPKGIVDTFSSWLADGVFVVFEWLLSNDDFGRNVTGSPGLIPEQGQSMVSPFVTLMELGDNLLDIALWAFWIILGLYTAARATGGAVGGSALSWIGIGGGVKGVLEGLIMAVLSQLPAVAALAVAGMVLAYVLPLLPILTWVMLIGAFALTAIEAVAAAPLAIVMMCTPEGRGVAGARMQTAIQLLTAIVLTPTLLTIGLVAAVVLSYLAFGVLNNLFWPVVETYNYGFFAMLMAVVIYTAAAYQICQWAVGTMHSLPSHIFDWFATGVGSRFGGQEAGALQVGSLAQSGAGQVAGALTAPGDVLKGRLADNRRQRQEEPPAA